MTELGIARPSRGNRLSSIDMLRGLGLVIMALDHARDMVTHPLSTDYSAAVDFTGSATAWFFTRWVIRSDQSPACFQSDRDRPFVSLIPKVSRKQATATKIR